ncbi:hypothetical protein Agub_g1868, partial [Astrephomene gubernaculifera]
MQSSQPDRAFDVFVKRTLSTIQKESWGRSKECKELREQCQNVLNLLHDHEQGHLQYAGSLAVAVLDPLYLACANANPRILDAALGCLHKLVAHAWLQGESSSGGQPSDADVVSRVIRTVVRCGEGAAAEGMQLSVIRALLTFTTAEHFVAHGDCLLAAVRMVFNLALGAEDDVIKRTASNALLQMLNTITKRVTAYQIYGSSSAATSRRSSLDGCSSSHNLGAAGGVGGTGYGYSRQLSVCSTPPGAPGGAAGGTSGHGTAGGAAPVTTQVSAQLHASAGPSVELQRATEAALAAAAAAAAARWAAAGEQRQPSTTAGGGISRSMSGQSLHRDAELDGAAAAEGGREGAAGGGEASRTAQLATLAEQRDLAGLEAALGAAASL